MFKQGPISAPEQVVTYDVDVFLKIHGSYPTIANSRAPDSTNFQTSQMQTIEVAK